MEQKNNPVHGAFVKLYLPGDNRRHSKALLTSVPTKIVTTVERVEKTVFDTLYNITVDIYEDNKNLLEFSNLLYF